MGQPDRGTAAPQVGRGRRVALGIGALGVVGAILVATSRRVLPRS